MDAASDTWSKPQWRKKMTAIRDALPEAERARLSVRLCRHVETEVLAPMRLRLGRPLTVFVYAAFKSEADPYTLVRECWRQGDTVAAPRMDNDHLVWHIVREPSDWRAGKWGVPEPDPSKTALLPDEQPPDAVLVPGLAFHPQGGRLGYGGGYYDRYYARLQQSGHTDVCWIGFAFSLQVVAASVPVEPHDLKLDVLATDEGITRI